MHGYYLIDLGSEVLEKFEKMLLTGEFPLFDQRFFDLVWEIGHFIYPIRINVEHSHLGFHLRSKLQRIPQCEFRRGRK